MKTTSGGNFIEFSTSKEFMNYEFGHFRKSALSARCIWEWKIKVQIWTFCTTYQEILKRNLVSQKSQERLALEHVEGIGHLRTRLQKRRFGEPWSSRF